MSDDGYPVVPHLGPARVRMLADLQYDNIVCTNDHVPDADDVTVDSSKDM